MSRRTASFVLPLGATINMDGTALYECVAVILLAQAYGVHLDFATQLLIVVTAVVTSIGVAGIHSASLVAIMVIMNAVGLPAEAVGVLFVFDRILDMARTAVNVYSDATCAVIVAQRSGVLRRNDTDTHTLRTFSRVAFRRWTTRQTSSLQRLLQHNSSASAVASPPPMHRLAIPRLLPVLRSAPISVTTSRAPDAPIGWPSAQAPP